MFYVILMHSRRISARFSDDELRAALRNQDVRYRMNSSSRVVRTNIDKGWVVVSSFPDFFVLYSAKQP